MSSDLREQLQSTLGTTYTLEQELGGGGMSRVFVATETSLGRKVVVKVLPPEMAEGVSVERFKREIQLAAQLQHPHIVPVLTAGEMGGVPYYTMPLVDGQSLRTRLTKAGALAITEVIGILRDVAKALAYAHERGVVHRDIKPDNVLLTGGSAVVTDFGVAKALSASKLSTPSRTLTQVGSSLGTPAYMAPEQVAADPKTDHRADLYAFGVMAYEMLAGRPPFHGRTPQKLLAAQMAERPDPIASIRGDTPPLLAEMVMQCLEKEADHRPQAAADVVRVLETVTSGGTHPAMPEVLLSGRPRVARALAYYAMAFAAVLVVAKAAIIALGLPDWVFPGAIVIMALGLPVILFTAFVHRGAYRAMTMAQLTPGGSPTSHSTMTKLALKASPWVSWRRTAQGGAMALGAFAVLVLAFMIMRAMGIGPAASLLAAGKLGDRAKLIVTDFATGSADSSLGSVLTEAVRTDLGQSRVVSVVSPSAVASALGRMQRRTTSRVDLALARDIAQREGIAAVVDGALTPLAGGYVVTLRLVGAESGDELAAYHASIDGPKELLPTIDKLTRQLRGKIGESLRAVRANPPLEEVTTPSLDALRKYADGARANDVEGNDQKAIPLLQEAIRLDTTFAMAYRKLGVAYANMGAPQSRVDSALGQAYRYRDRLTERERGLAEASYFDLGPGHDRRKAEQAYRALLARDSLDPTALHNLGVLQFQRREYAASDSTLGREPLAGGATAFGYMVRVDDAISLGKPAEAESSLAAFRREFPNSPVIPVAEIDVLYARGLLDSLTRRLKQMRQSDPNADNRAMASHALADLALLHGQLAEHAQYLADALVRDSMRGAPALPLTAANDSATVTLVFRDDAARALRVLDAAMARRRTQSPTLTARVELPIAQSYAMAGRPDRARAILAQLDAATDSATWRSLEPVRHLTQGFIALAERRADDAIREMRAADVLPDGPADPCAPCAMVWIGRGYDVAGNADSAIAIYERYLATPSAYRRIIDGPMLPTVQRRLGEMYEAKGDRARAAAHYRAFVELWQHADAELQPQVAEVRQRLSRLTDLEPGH